MKIIAKIIWRLVTFRVFLVCRREWHQQHLPKHNMKTEINNMTKMLTNKVANLVAQGMDEEAAFSAVMQRLENEFPEVYNLLITIAHI